MDSSSAAHDSVKDTVPGNQAQTAQSKALITAQILPYAFAKRHGVLIGQIDGDVVNVLYHGSPDPIVLGEVSRITHTEIS